jgi:hypothetical protein
MPLYRTGTGTWSSLTNAWSTYTGGWSDPAGTSTGNISLTSNVTDIGEIVWVWPTTEVGSVGVGNAGITITYATSTDNVTFSTQSVGTLYGRYFKTIVEADADELTYIFTEYHQEISTKTYQNLDTTTLSGNTAARTIDVSGDFSKIFGQVVNAASTENKILLVDVGNIQPANLTFTLRDVDTYGKVAVDGNVNITITGYPSLELVSSTGQVRRSDNAAP